MLDTEQTRAQVSSPLFLGSLWTHTGSALVHPGKLGDGLRAAAVQAGVRVYEYSRPPRAEAITRRRVGEHRGRRVRARQVLLATSAYPPLLRAIRRCVAPVYDYALMTEPLAPAQREAIGWRGARASATWPTSSTTTG